MNLQWSRKEKARSSCLISQTFVIPFLVIVFSVNLLANSLVLPSGIRLSMSVLVPKNNQNSSEGKELLNQNNLEVKIELLAYKSHSSMDYGCVLLTESHMVNVRNGSLNLTFADLNYPLSSRDFAEPVKVSSHIVKVTYLIG